MSPSPLLLRVARVTSGSAAVKALAAFAVAASPDAVGIVRHRQYSWSPARSSRFDGTAVGPPYLATPRGQPCGVRVLPGLDVRSTCGVVRPHLPRPAPEVRSRDGSSPPTGAFRRRRPGSRPASCSTPAEGDPGSAAPRSGAVQDDMRERTTLVDLSPRADSGTRTGVRGADPAVSVLPLGGVAGACGALSVRCSTPKALAPCPERLAQLCPLERARRRRCGAGRGGAARRSGSRVRGPSRSTRGGRGRRGGGARGGRGR